MESPVPWLGGGCHSIWMWYLWVQDILGSVWEGHLAGGAGENGARILILTLTLAGCVPWQTPLPLGIRPPMETEKAVPKDLSSPTLDQETPPPPKKKVLETDGNHRSRKL